MILSPELSWDGAQLPPDHPFDRVLLSLVALRGTVIELVGTAFIVSVGERIVAATAAHNFDYARRLLHPHNRYASSTLPEFRPPPPQVDLDKVKCLYINDGRMEVFSIEIAAWDSASDTAIFEVKADTNRGMFRHEVDLTDEIPTVGDEVCMIAYEHGLVRNTPVPGGHSAQFERRLILRAGRVEAEDSDRQALLHGASVRTTIPATFGMSGGLVARAPDGPDSPVVAFGFVSRSMQWDDPTLQLDKTVSGRSYVGILPVRLLRRSGDNREYEVQIMQAEIAGKRKT